MIVSVPFSENFSERLIRLVKQQSDDPFKRAQTEIILPTKRAVRSLKEAFISHAAQSGMLLPRLTALYDLNDLSIDVPPALSGTERILLLAKLCQAKPNINTLDKAIKVAIGLGSLLDEFYQHETDLSQLEKLVPQQEFAEHWNETIRFLDIIRTVWPQILQERNQIDETDRTIRLIKAYTQKLSQKKPDHPIIMAGFDGSLPSVINLTKALNKHDNCFILLNGFDKNISDNTFKNLSDSHFQYGFKKLLDALKTEPKNVNELGLVSPREKLIQSAFKPVEETDEWRTTSFPSESIQNVTRIECETQADEAVAIAVLLREVLETPNQTGALVTNDRNLARRVILEMKRWSITLDDSAGIPLSKTPQGIFLSLLVDFASNGGKGPDLVALLKHPFSANGKLPHILRNELREAEKTARQTHQKLQFPINESLKNFLTCFQEKQIAFDTLLKAHLQAAEDLAQTPDESGSDRLWSNSAGETAYTLLTEFISYAPVLGVIDPKGYQDAFKMLLDTKTVRPKFGMHPRLDILGPIEARLIKPDVCIIGGLNEGSFPSFPETGPWINRPMRQALSLPSLENKIAIEALDFAHCFLSPKVYLTRSLKENGSPSIPSRFLSRLDAVLSASHIWYQTTEASFFKQLDRQTKSIKIERPAPTPPVESRPRQLSATRIETWMRNPYAIYARYILKLFKLDDLEKIQTRQAYGNALHKALEKFMSLPPNTPNSLDFLLDLGNQCMDQEGLNVAEKEFYQPKFKRSASFFLDQQNQIQPLIKKTILEQTGKITFDLEGGAFTLTAKADRIDLLKDGTATIIDYKTGSPPSKSEITAGYAPQLPLEGLILKRDGFNSISAKNISSLSFWHLSGKEQGDEIVSVLSSKSKDTIETLIQKTEDGLITLINAFDHEQTPYYANPIPAKAPKYDDYKHLSREQEWIHGDENEEDDE